MTEQDRESARGPSHAPGSPERGPGHSGNAGIPADTAKARRLGYPIGPIVLLVIAAAAMWGSTRLTWVTISSSDGLTQPRTDTLDGGVWFGALAPCALVLLAAVAAVLATRGWLRRVVGVLLALVAAVTAVPAFALLTGSGATEDRAAALAELPGRATLTGVTTSAFPAVLTLAAALAAFTAGVVLARMPGHTAQLSGKYDNPVFRRAAARQVAQRRTAADDPSAEFSERVLWDALDAGTDPTEDPANPDSSSADRGPDHQGDPAR